MSSSQRARTAGGVLPVLRRQRRCEPAVRQRMQMPEAFGQIVERHDVLEAQLEQRSLDRHIGRRGDADGEADVALLSLLGHVVGMQQPHTRTIPDRSPARRASRSMTMARSQPHDLEEIARQPAEVARAIERQRPVGRSRGEPARRGRELGEQRRRLVAVRQPRRTTAPRAAAALAGRGESVIAIACACRRVAVAGRADASESAQCNGQFEARCRHVLIFELIQ